MTTRPYGADHTNVGQPPRKRDSISPQSLTILMMKRSGASPRGVSQLGTDTRESYGRSSRAYAKGEGPYAGGNAAAPATIVRIRRRGCCLTHGRSQNKIH